MKRQEFTQSPILQNCFIISNFLIKKTIIGKKKWHIEGSTYLQEHGKQIRKNRFLRSMFDGVLFHKLCDAVHW